MAKQAKRQMGQKVYSTEGVDSINVDTAGNVGIGTASPAQKLHVSSAVRADGGFVAVVGGITTVVSADASGTYIETQGANNQRFFTNGSERMRIDSSGKLSVGNNSSSNTIGGFINIENNGLTNQTGYSYYFNTASPTAPGFYVNSPQLGTNNANWKAFYSRVAGGDRFFVQGDGVIYSTSTSVQPIVSDAALKQDIVDYDNGLNEVLKMKPRYFSWKAEPERKEAGFIAQEMGEALPGSMVENGDGNKTYRVEWYPLLVKAIQEQQEIIGKQASAIEKLEARLAALESK